MQHAIARRALVLAALLALTACGDTGKQGSTMGGGVSTIASAPVASDVGMLVPENTDALVYVPSVQALIDKIQTVVAVFGEEAASGFDPDDMLRGVPVGDQLDRTKPMAIAVTIPDQGAPIPTFVLPVKDVAAVDKMFKERGMQAPPHHGNHVLVAQGPAPELPKAPPAIAQQVPKGDLVLRVNLARLIDAHGKELREQVSQLGEQTERMAPEGGPNFSGMFKGMEKEFGKLLDSAEMLDVSVQIDGTKVHLKGLFTMKEGSELAKTPAPTGDLASMAGALPDGYPVVALVNVPMKRMMDWLEPMMESVFEQMPEEQRSAFQKQWKQAASMYDYVGDSMAIAVDVGADGMSFAEVVQLTDSKKFFETWNQLLDGDYAKLMADMGIIMTRLPATEVAGHEVQHFTMTFDAEKMMSWNPATENAPPEAAEMSKSMMNAMFGEGGMKMHVADVNGRLVAVMGDESTMEAAIKKAETGSPPTSGPIADALAMAGGKPTLLVHVEGRQLLRGAMALARKMMPEQAESSGMPEIPEGKPLDLVVYATGGGRYYAGGFSMDVGALKDIVEAFTSAGH